MPAVLERPRTRSVRPRVSPPAVTRLWTSEAFLDWLEPGVHADLINGEIAMHSPVNLNHARLINFVDALLRAYIEEEDLGELHRETVAVRLSIRETFMPDLAYFTKTQAARLPETHVPFAPTFVLEALSPATAKNDTGRKFAAYELHDVQEYWILDPQKLDHRFYRRSGDMLEEFAEKEAVIRSTSIPGFWVRREWLNPAKPPKVSECLKQLLARRSGKRR
ncbi:MAG: Uma2 family endonuclease [Prosthecobacter sp.]|jgi:Uma2 family endonuclease|uniref:Uma2 family endonuclease n=1 Tax=Prosthecobacter sp. TaxID=1965333 RepID=UPI001A0B80D8|nr:Uma2 family endonuclease [Prosthecobacter sp.]MBE2282343.1 Uma2 family endonuclease [Prosthecobacter sp.]